MPFVCLPSGCDRGREAEAVSQLPRRKTSCKENASRTQRRRRSRSHCLPGTERLENRLLLASDPAHVFAKFDGVPASSSQVGQFNISIRPADFVLASNHIIVGLQLRQSNEDLPIPRQLK